MTRRILHVVGSLNRGGVETWLMHVLRQLDPGEFQTEFAVHTEREGAFDREILARGGRIHHCVGTRQPWRYARNFTRLLRQHGPFHVVHSHVYWYSGFVLRLAYHAGIPVRIAHSHTAPPTIGQHAGRRAYQRLMRRWILRYSTHQVAVSRAAAEALYGRHPEKPPKVIPYGLDFTRFRTASPSEEFREALGIPAGRKVIGHVGSFRPVKNHRFIAEVFERVVVSGLDAHLLLVGDGDLLPAVRADIASRGLSDRCTFAGLQADVAPFLSLMDVFVFPSHYEGLPIVTLESQAAGVPIVASSSVPDDVDVIPELVERLPLSAGASAWAAAVMRRCRDARPRNGAEASVLQVSRFALPTCVAALGRLYGAGESGAEESA